MNLFYTLLSKTAETEAVKEGASKLFFEPMQFINMLPYMGKGMLVIFILIGVIILVTMLVNKIFSK